MNDVLVRLLVGELALVLFLAILSSSETAIHAARRPHILEELGRGRRPLAHPGDVREAFELTLPPSEDYDTLGGYIVHELGRLPRPGEEVRTDGVRFAVESIEARRIRRVRVTRETAERDEEAAER